jgi:hypothetical protein
MKWLRKNHFLWVIQKSIKFSKYSSYTEHQMNKHGQGLINYLILNKLSLNLKYNFLIKAKDFNIAFKNFDPLGLDLFK